MNRVLVVFSDGLLSELDSARGLVSRSAWIRQAVEDKLMKEAVAPLVPGVATGGICPPCPPWEAEPKPKARRKRVKELESETLKAMESVEKDHQPPTLQPRSLYREPSTLLRVGVFGATKHL